MARVAPTISVIIPTYNRRELLKETIDSVLKQTIAAHEIIVVDDASTDGTPEAVRQYGPPVTLLTQDHAMEAAARNLGISKATGEWIAVLDSDDIWKPTKLERQIEFIEKNPQCGLVHTGYYMFGGSNDTPRYQHFVESNYKIEYLLFAEDWICISSVMFRKSIAVKFTEWSFGCSDILFFADLLRMGIQFGYVDEPLVGYRIHASSLNTVSEGQCKGASSQWRWVTENFAGDIAEQVRLQRNMLNKALDRMEDAKSRRDWSNYWPWRRWVQERWIPSEAPPRALSVKIYPPIFYKLRDRLRAARR
jgi:glycosyltransferase involved in cell wall biosynthesis